MWGQEKEEEASVSEQEAGRFHGVCPRPNS